MALKDYISESTIKALAKHTVSTLVAFLCFWLTSNAMKLLVADGWLRSAIDVIEGVWHCYSAHLLLCGNVHRAI